jgi:eukaryotic-like serine/threonine-protein kinase
MDEIRAAGGRDLAECFVELWQRADSPPDVFEYLSAHPDLALSGKAAICAIDQGKRWEAGVPLLAEKYFEKLPDVASAIPLKLKLIVSEFVCRRRLGQEAAVADYVARFPDLDHELRVQLYYRAETAPGQIRRAAATVTMAKTSDAKDGGTIEGSGADADYSVIDVAKGNAVSMHPGKIGRYRVLRILGDGGFGRVFLAYDDTLLRQVAIKVPHPHRILGPEDVENYLNEARIVAKLDAREVAIVPVYDCGQTDDGLCFVVSQYIEGSDLATKTRRTPLTFSASAELVSKVAKALHAAHLQGVVHRDVKPANILIDVNDRPFLTDFGIALKEEDYGTGDRILGTIPYMSPEQLRGEGHLVDGRSDIFSLGIVLYELICGRRPFSSNRIGQPAWVEPRPPRQINDAIPKELERICLKALSYRVSERYNTALDLAADLGEYLKVTSGSAGPASIVVGLSNSGIAVSSGGVSAAREITIVPKGLRSFDRDDAGFFLELLPGPRDKEGLPESIHFWRTRIRETDPEKTFRVALLYGPSGCGKSSLLKAGLLPRLGDDVISIYVESTPLDTELRILNTLRRECPGLPNDRGLLETVTALRRGRGGRKKVVIVLDQFEQWLHARPEVEKSDLIRTLRQADGQHLQCIISVRDDFWMAVTRVMEELDIELVPGENIASIDLFSVRHAKKVLTAIGRAYGAVPAAGDEFPADQKQFIDLSVAGLAHDDRVIPVQLALFAQMVKDRPWARATLKAVGGTAGVGVTFLEETFNGPTASPSHRLHQAAARRVLGALLSDSGGNIKGTMRSYHELLEISGYQQRPRDFDSLLRMLDAELRLITPTDPKGFESAAAPVSGSETPHSERYYHLTHDYLVPSLRDWLTRKQKETRRGRAELLLAERAAMWSARPSSRSLPSFLEWLSILCFTTHRSRVQENANRKVLQAASRHYLGRICLGAAAMALFAVVFRWQSNRSRARGMVDSLFRARAQGVPTIVAEMAPVRAWVDPLLRERLAASEPSTPGHLYAAMALLPVDRAQEDTVFEGLLTAPPKDVAAILEVLTSGGDRDKIVKRLWNEASGPKNAPGRRFRAGAALASLDPPKPVESSGNWHKVSDFLARQLIAELAAETASVDSWIELLLPVRTPLYPDLRAIFVDSNRPAIDRHMAATVLGEFASDNAGQLVDLMLVAEPDQYAILLPKLHHLGDPAREALIAAFNAPIPTDGNADQRRQPVKRRANAAVALLEFGLVEPLVAVLSKTSDPDLCTYAEDRVSRLAARPDLLLQSVGAAGTGLRASLVRCLAGTSYDRIPEDLHEPLTAMVARLFKSDADSGVHSAAEWALRSWGQAERLSDLKKELETAQPTRDGGWYVNRTGFTLAVFKGPLDVRTGSPPNEPGRDASDEKLQVRPIVRDFAVSTTEVTLEQFLKFLPNFRHAKKKEYSPTPDCPVAMVTWHRTAEYCNWLSEREGIAKDQWCYRIVKGRAIPEANYLHRTGYRLPTDAEWEHACRGGTTTAFSWGNDPALFPRYAWTIKNSGGRNWPVGSLCPNRFGLFDVHGNASEWVLDNYFFDDRSHPILATGEDTEDKRPFGDESERDVRGGAAGQFVQYQRSANRTPTKAKSEVSPHSGFRIARTLTGSSGR